MTRLLPELPFAADETPMSWAARLAELHTGGAPDRFLSDMGLSAQALAMGEPDVVRRLAEIGGADPDAVARNAVRRIKPDMAAFRGETFHEDFVLAGQSRVCPRCLVEDVEAGSGDPRLHLRGRVDWLFPALRCCPHHHVRLIDIRGGLHVFARRPMSAYATENWALVQRGAESAAPGSPGALQAYVAARLAGQGGPAWLDGQPIDAGVKACEILGAVALRGARPNVAAFTDVERDEADAAGLALAAEGPHAIRALFERLQAACPTDGGHAGPKAMFGYLFDWATERKPHRADAPLVALLRAHIVETMPVGPGDILLHRRVAARRIHSVRTLAQQSRLNPRRLRKLLEARGVIPEALRGMSDHRAWFDAAAGEAVARELREGLTMQQAKTFLGAPLTLVSALVREGLLPTLATPDPGHQLGEYRFARDALSDFLDQLLVDAAEVDEAPEDFVTLKVAAHATARSVADVIRAVLDGRLAERRRLAGSHGVAAALVSRSAARDLFVGQGDPGFCSAHRLRRRLRTTERVVAALMRERPGGPILPSFPAPASLARAERVVPTDVVDAFERDYVALVTLAAERRTNAPALRRRLAGVGVAPAFDKAEVGATFYRRAALPAEFQEVDDSVAHADDPALARSA